MLRIIVIIVLAIHGSIHIMGFTKAFAIGQSNLQLQPISRGMGMAWLLCAALFLLSALLLILRIEKWWILTISAIALSQFVIIRSWQEASYGTWANVILLLVVISAAAMWNFKKHYMEAASETVNHSLTLPAHCISEEDLLPLPSPVQRFLRKAGVVGTLRPRNMQLTFTGAIREFNGPWMPFTTVQTNSFGEPSRFFWMDARMKGLPVKGLHAFKDGKANMQVKLLGLVPVAKANGPMLDTAETVTWFNDLCLFAPGALIDPRITWSAVDDRSAQASFTNKGITINAVLVFDHQDRIIDFISDDRYSVSETPPAKRRFSTPARDHRELNGILLVGYGEGVWHMPDGPFSYGQFTVTSVRYDVGS